MSHYQRSPVGRADFSLTLTLGLMLFVMLLTGCQWEAPPPLPVAVQGVLDLRGQTLTPAVTIGLSGEWSFYWQQLLSPDDFTGATPPPMTAFAVLPSRWNGLEVAGQSLTGDGYATYRLEVLLSQPQQALALYIPESETAYRLYVNGQLLSTNGVVGPTADQMTPQWLPRAVSFDVPRDRIDIILQVSNFYHRNGGPGSLMELGSEATIRQRVENRLALTVFLFGSISFMGIYHLGLFMLRRKDKTPFYFSLVCFLVGIRALVINEYYLSHVFPWLEWWFIIKLSYLSIYLTVPAFLLFLRSLFPQECSRWVHGILLILAIIFSIQVLLTSAPVFTQTLPIYQLLMIIMVSYSLGVLILATWRRREGAWMFLMGFVAIFFTVNHDILVANQLIVGEYYNSVGLFIFMFAQAFLISRRFSTAFNQVETLSADLEQRVIDRTRYLQLLNDQIRGELALARQMQYSLLPPAHPHWPQVDMICYMTPASEVGGDFYDYHVINEGHFMVVVGDVSGKGVSAALLMATSIVQFDAACGLNLSPVALMAHLDTAILPYTQPHRQNCALCYIELELGSKEAGVSSNVPTSYSLLPTPYFLLHIVNAGGIPPYIKHHNGMVEQPEIGGFALGQGLGAKLGYQTLTLSLVSGDSIILVSDGVIEAKNTRGELLGFDRFQEIVEHVALGSAAEILEQLKRAVFEFIGQAEPHDDMTMVVMRV